MVNAIRIPVISDGTCGRFNNFCKAGMADVSPSIPIAIYADLRRSGESSSATTSIASVAGRPIDFRTRK